MLVERKKVTVYVKNYEYGKFAIIDGKFSIVDRNFSLMGKKLS